MKNLVILCSISMALISSLVHGRTVEIASGDTLCTEDGAFCLDGRLTHNTNVNTLVLDARIPRRQAEDPGRIRVTLEAMRTNGQTEYFTLATDTRGKTQSFVDVRVIPPFPSSTQWRFVLLEFFPESTNP